MRLKDKRGITLIELIIVLAVIAIIGAILIPTFLDTTERARLKSDIQSARVIQSALELYNAEQPTRLNAADMAGIIDELDKAGYIDKTQVIIQTEGANWVMDNDKVVVDISACVNTDIKDKVFDQLTNQEKTFVRGGSK